MSYITELADRIRSRVSPDLVPEEDATRLFLIYAALALAKGEATTPRDVHNAWAAWMAERDPTHGSLQPFEKLDPEKQAEDDPFVAAIRSALAG